MNNLIKKFVPLICVVILCFNSFFSFCTDGKSLFRANCAMCHSIGKGRSLGPDLKGVAQKRSEEWLIKFIRSSQTLVNSGDADAIALFKEYNGVPMTDFMFLSDEQIRSIITYINEKGDSQKTDSVAVSVSPKEIIHPDEHENQNQFLSTKSLLWLSLSVLLLIIIFIVFRIMRNK